MTHFRRNARIAYRPLLGATPILLSMFGAAASVALEANDADACGGCFVPAREETIVSAHQMAFSVSAQETTLWDQIQYDGDPAEFSWVLPIKGTVEIGLSSDALFAAMQDLTRVQVNPPNLPNCPSDPCGGGGASAGFGGSGGGANGGVEVLAEQTVGPFETVQLSATDPNALFDWLSTNNFVLPPDIQPVVTAYVNEGFNFLAMRLQPGAGVDAMRPVRVTSQGAGVTLPLRMVAAGTGATTAIRLWVVAEGRYQPANFPSLEVNPADVVWDFSASQSNYSALRNQALNSGAGDGWLTVASLDTNQGAIISPLDFAVEYDTANSGYGDTVMEAQESFDADMDKLFGNLPSTVRLTRMDAELPRTALASDLVLGAANTQAEVSPIFNVSNSVNAPACPPVVNTCGDDEFFEGGGDDFDEGGPSSPFGNGNRDPLGDGGCAVGSSSGAPLGLLLMGMASGLAIVRRRTKR